MIKQPNSRQKRKFKYGFKGEGSHKRFGIGVHPNTEIEKLKGSYSDEVNRTNPINKAYSATVNMAIANTKGGYKMDNKGNILGYTQGSTHMGSKPYRIIKKAAHLHKKLH